MKLKFYELSLSTRPFTSAESQIIANYKDLSHAERVGSFVADIFGDTVLGGLSYSIQEHEKEVIHTDIGLRIKMSSDDLNAHIKESLLNEDFDELVHYIPTMLKSKMVGASTLRCVDTPIQIVESDFYVALLNFSSSERTHTIVLGYYQYTTTAEKIISFISNCNPQSISEGFTAKIVQSTGTFVEYSSGRMFLGMSQEFHEIHTSYDSAELLRVYKVARMAIQHYCKQPYMMKSSSLLKMPPSPLRLTVPGAGTSSASHFIA